MANGQFGAVLIQVHRLFSRGTVAGLTESQLLERFIARRDDAAFEALVIRHGPMVLGVCRRLLADPNDVEDAFQATFLVLVKKAGSIRDPARLACWLHGVAHRVAARARADARRRRAREREGHDMAAQPGPEPSAFDDIGPLVHEELRRLPEKYRAPLVLCYLEGRTHEDAAHALGWPVGTVKGRLARARDQLRGRLTRRGLTLPAGIVAATLARDARAAVPTVLLDSTLKAAMSFAAGKTLAAGAVPASAVLLANEVLQTMFLTKLKVLALTLIGTGLIGGGAGAFALQDGGVERGETKTVEKTGTTTVDQGQPKPIDHREPVKIQTERMTKTSRPIRTLTSPADAPEVARAQAKVARARVEIGREAYEIARANFKSTGNVQDVVDASLNMLGTVFEVDASPDHRLAALQDHLDRMKDLAELENQRQRAAPQGITPAHGARIDLDIAKAELWLAEAKAGLEPSLGGIVKGGNAPSPTTRPAPAGPPRAEPPDEDAEKTAAIEKALSKPISMPFAEETPLQDVIKYIQTATVSKDLPDGIPIYLDPAAFQYQPMVIRGGMSQQEAMMASNLPRPKSMVEATIKLNLEGVRLKTSLRLLLNQVGLAFTVKEGLLIISSPFSPEFFKRGLDDQGGMGGGMGGMR